MPPRRLTVVSAIVGGVAAAIQWRRARLAAPAAAAIGHGEEQTPIPA